MKHFLPDHVHAVAIDADVVFLDTVADVYFCLAGAGELLAVRADGVVMADEPKAAAPLVEAGLLSTVGGARARAVPPPAMRSLSISASGATPGRAIKALSANARAARAVADLTFAEILAMAAHVPADPASADRPARATRLEADAARFARLAPWLPHSGVCLMRSLQLLLYLRALGHAPAWVFGVRTWPFKAHCWLQSGDVVLDDHLEHVRAFVPIMAI
ncbi:lasso peptide biosynthesis B2 protein [Caulobacter sp. UC70_42]|uniref:lasso peptide biosynthesis B2 protein n=1 Tax=Caulobacter sp. UC70_42 TaxID=3374551 RepID=UPI003757B291